MLLERTCVGLDVHARSVVGCAIDAEAGEIRTLRLPGKTEQIVEWVTSLPGPVAVTYEAGPTGFGLARALGSLGLRCEVVAPSKLERPPGDKVKTDRRDAERLASGCCASVSSPRCGCPPRPKKLPAIWCVPERMPAGT